MPASTIFSAAFKTRILPAALLLTCAATALAQAPEWSTSSVDPARDAWQQGPSKINPQTVKGLTMLWKTKVENKTMGMQSFREPLIIPGVKTDSGTKTVAFLVGASNDVFALDTDTGTVLWKKKLKWESAKPQEPGEGRGFICTNAQSATPVITPLPAAQPPHVRPRQRRLSPHHGARQRQRA